MARNTATGTAPQGAHDETQAARWVRQMFADVSPKYDLVNHLLSFNIDRRWRRRLLRELAPVLANADATVLDLCCGTGDVLLDIEEASAAKVLGADFCHPMLVAAQHKALRQSRPAALFEGDALHLPLPDDSLDAIAIAFGFRNLANYRAGLDELHRVLKTGGMLAMLEFSHPPALLVKAVYGLYSRVFLPLVGGLLSGSREAYTYLPASIGQFPEAEELRRMIESAGFKKTGFELLTGGIAALHVGEKSASGRIGHPPVDLFAEVQVADQTK